MTPARYDFSIWAGSTFRKTITVLSGDVGSPAQDLTGYTAAMTIVGSAQQTLYSLTTSNGRITLGGVAGSVALYIPATDTINFTAWAPAALYDLMITNTGGNGDVTTLLWGQVRVQSLA